MKNFPPVVRTLACLVVLALMAAFVPQPTAPSAGPWPSMDVEFESFMIDTETCQVFAYATGSQFLIEPGTFMTQDGNAVRGLVEVKYREIHDPAEMILAGVRMRTKVGKGFRALESGGMFEIRAEQDGQPLEIAPGKRIRVRMAAFTDIPGLEVYRYDEDAQAWDLTDLKYRIKQPDPEATASAAPEVWEDEWTGEDFGEPFGGGEGDFGWGDDFVEAEDPAAVAYRTQLFRDLEIDQLGFYNYDKLWKDEDAVLFTADFDFGPGIEKNKAVVYVVYKQTNTVITYYKYDWEKNFRLLPNEKGSIFALLPDQKVAVFTQDQYKNLDIASLKGKAFTFQMSLFPDKVASPAQLRNVLGL